MKSAKYYRIDADPKAAPRWYLSEPTDPNGEEVDPRTFTKGGRVGAQPKLMVPLQYRGPKFDFNFAAFDMIVTPKNINEALERLVGSEAIQRFPVAIEDGSENFEILQVCQLVKCVDESRIEFTKWTDSDGRPEKVGHYRMIIGLKIDAARANGLHIFRVEEWPIALIVSEEVKRLFESKGVTGVAYERVD